MKKRRLTLSFIAVCLALVSAFLPIASSAEGALVNNYDYSNAASQHNITLDSYDILSSAISTPISDAERDYLRKHGEIKLSYNAVIPTSMVISEYDNGKLTVKAAVYTYEAANGSRVAWTPASVSFDGEQKTFSFNSDEYTASFENVAQQEGKNVEVTYTTSFSLAKRDVNSILNKALTDAEALKAELQAKNEEYESLKAEYELDCLEYSEYLDRLSEYQLKYASYTEYLLQKKLYDDALSEYNRYLDDLQAYNNAVANEENYDKLYKEYTEKKKIYDEYLQALLEYQENEQIYLEQYRVYQEKINFINSQLAVINATKTKMTDNRTVYSAIMGPLVTQVLENKDLFTGDTFGADEAVIDNAGIATEQIRTLLTEYFSYDTDAGKYLYYQTNYEAFRDSFTMLLKSLDELYRNRRIRGAIIAEGKGRKYVILLSQLTIIANGLTDGKVYGHDGSYVLNNSYVIDGQTVSAILENKTYITDTDTATPRKDLPYPDTVEKPIPPKEVQKPIPPTHVSIPAKPEEVSNPGEAPIAVAEPEAPIAVAEPVAPTKYIPSEEVSNLVAEYDRGTLIQRQALASDVILTREKKMTKCVFGSNSLTVVFFDTNNNELYRTEAELGSAIDYYGVLPTKSEDVMAKYEFIGWTQDMAVGQLYDLAAINGDGAVYLYPMFKANVKSYNISFVVDGACSTFEVKYGEIPMYNGTPQKTADSNCDYVFIGWDSQIESVNGDKIYTALFEKKYILSYNNGKDGADIKIDNGYLIADNINTASSRLNIEGALERAASLGCGIKIKTGTVTLTISYSNVLSMKMAGECEIDIKLVQVGAVGYRYRVDVIGKTRQASSNVYKLHAQFPSPNARAENIRLFYLDSAENRVYVNSSSGDGKIAFNLNTGVDYRALAEFNISILAHENCTLMFTSDSLTEGSIINVSYTVPNGVELVKLYMVLEDGTDVQINDGHFRMPAQNISIGMVIKRIEYTVSFVYDGNVIATKKYYYGDTVIPPEAPSKASTDKLSFTFRGWSPAITTVTSDFTYVADYKATLLPPKQEPQGIQISPQILRLIVAGAVAGGMIVAVVIPSAIVSVIVVSKAKKQYIRKSKTNK